MSKIRVAILGSRAEHLGQALGIDNSPLENADCAIFEVSAVSGISPEVQSAWSVARELYIPSLIAITDLENSEIDFDDMSAIAGKMLDPVVTPYLVLHSEDGFPTALINLETLLITDYSLGLRKTNLESDPEHKELVAEFRDEYLETLREMGEDAFGAGMLFPAIPVSLHLKLGLSEIAQYLDQVPILR